MRGRCIVCVRWLLIDCQFVVAYSVQCLCKLNVDCLLLPVCSFIADLWPWVCELIFNWSFHWFSIVYQISVIVLIRWFLIYCRCVVNLLIMLLYWLPIDRSIFYECVVVDWIAIIYEFTVTKLLIVCQFAVNSFASVRLHYGTCLSIGCHLYVNVIVHNSLLMCFVFVAKCLSNLVWLLTVHNFL